MNTNKKVQPESKYTPSGVTEQLPPAPKYMGGSGAFGLVGGANIVSAGKQILKSGIGSTNLISAGKQFLNSPHVNAVKGAVNLIKNVLKGNKKTTGVIKNAFNKPPVSPVVNQSRNLKQQWPSSKFKSGIGARGPIPTVSKSKPVDFMGPNPANKIGAGGNSYPI
jgi:hypothetical protein